MSLFIPFDFNTKGTVYKATGNYTVLTDEYCIVQAQVQNGGSIDVDGTSILTSVAESTPTITEISGGSSSTSNTALTVFTTTAGTSFDGFVYLNGVNGDEVEIQVGGVSLAVVIFDTGTKPYAYQTGDLYYSVPIKAGGGEAIKVRKLSGSNSYNYSASGYETDSYSRSPTSANMWWVSTAGEVITITGSGNFVAMRYDVPS